MRLRPAAGSRVKCVMRLLLVKLSSLGDVIHNLPVVSDLARAVPGIEIDWITEAPYAALAGLHPDVHAVLPLHLRALKKNWWSPAAWRELGRDRKRVQTNRYERVLDTQGLLKSARVARWAGAPIAGYSVHSAREPWATKSYAQQIVVERELHAVERNRLLAAGAFGYALSGDIDYGLSQAQPAPPGLPAGPYVVFLHATSRADKQWPNAHWIALGKRMHAQGLSVLLPWGSAAEKAVSVELAAAIPGAVVAPAYNLIEAAGALAHAKAVVGVDTGLAHLAVALGRPTVGIYCTTSPSRTGLIGGTHAINLGDGSPTQPDCPTVEAVCQALLPNLPAGGK